MTSHSEFKSSVKKKKKKKKKSEYILLFHCFDLGISFISIHVCVCTDIVQPSVQWHD